MPRPLTKHEDGTGWEDVGCTAVATERKKAAQTLPLNSKRLTASLLRQLAGGQGIPTSASQGDLRPMVEAKLTEDGRDPLHTQVVLTGGTHISLQDESGVFHEVELEPPEVENPLSSDSEEKSESETVLELRSEIAQLKMELEEQKAKTRDMWRLNCEQLSELDCSLTEKDEEITRLRNEVSRLQGSSHSDASETASQASAESGGVPHSSRTRRGEAPPVDSFTGEDPECRLDDWLPTLRRAAGWNSWTEGDMLIQLAGHLKG